MRYHYVAFAHLLSKLRRMEPYGGRPGHSALCIVTEWKTWNQFFHFSSAILGTSARGCRAELCDCWRDDTAGSEFREYRTLQVTFPDSCQDTQRNHSRPQSSVMVSYQQVFNQPDSLTTGLDALKYYEHSYRQQPPDVIIINMGLHIEEEFFTVASSVMDAGEAVKRKHNTTMLWKTTTHGISGAWDKRAEESELLAAHKAHKAYAAYDVGKMVLAAKEQRLNLCWDGVHFLPFVYEQFNDVLLNYMCE